MQVPHTPFSLSAFQPSGFCLYNPHFELFFIWGGFRSHVFSSMVVVLAVAAVVVLALVLVVVVVVEVQLS